MANLSFWMNKNDLGKLENLYNNWWNLARVWMLQIQKSSNAQIVSEDVLNLLAWERDITRVPGESLELFRRRVGSAHELAQMAGETNGFMNIFRFFGFGEIGVNERVLGKDWDVVELETTEKTYAENSALLTELVKQYGLTCRRYEWITRSELLIKVQVFNFDFSVEYAVAN